MSGPSVFESYAYQRIGQAILAEGASRGIPTNPPYVMSLHVWHEMDDPAQPRIALSFEYPPEPDDEPERLERWRDDGELQWNYASWGQHLDNVIGEDDESARVFVTMFDDRPPDDHGQVVVDALIGAVQHIHRDRLTEQHLGASVPILIHELEYSQRIARWNVEANGHDRVTGFVEWIRQWYEGDQRTGFDQAMRQADARYQRSLTDRGASGAR